MKFLEDINLGREDRNYLIFLLCFAILLSYVMIQFHLTRGAFNSDIYIYLSAALDFAGLNYNGLSDPSHMFNSPVIFYLTSILFRMGHVSIKSLFFVTGIFGIFGIFGMYTFLKCRFSPLLSFTGAILYSSFSLTLFYFANGMLDTSAVAMMLWTFIFVVAAVNKNYKYYCLVGISFVVCIFVRFTSTFILVAILLYVLKDYDLINLIECLFYDTESFKERLMTLFRSSEFKWMIIAVGIALILIAYVFYVLLSFKSTLGYFAMANYSINHFQGPHDFNHVEDKLFYVKNFLSLLYSERITSPGMIENFNNPSVLAYFIFSVVIFGIGLKLVNFIKNRDFFKNNKKDIDFRNINSKIVLAVSLFILSAVFIISLDYSYLLSVFLIWLIFLILMSLAKSYPIDQDNFALFMLCLGQFVFYFIIFSLQNLKCVRYILPTLPAFVYFAIYSLEIILKFIKCGFDDEKSLENTKGYESSVNLSNIKRYAVKFIPLLLIVILLFTTFNFTNTVEMDPIAISIDSVSNYLIDYDSDYQQKSIGVMSGEMFYEWYFQTNVGVFDENDTSSLNYTYVICRSNLNNTNYHKLYNSWDIFLYEING